MMTVLVVGASGTTGKLLVEQLLNYDMQVKIIVRTVDNLPEAIIKNENVFIIRASILELSDNEITEHVKDCNAVVSCLGHNLSIKGIYGKPRRLVTDATRMLCHAIQANNPEQPVKFVLMNTAGNSNRDLSEKISFSQKCIIWLIRLLLPPHLDNEKVADYLRTNITQYHRVIEWVAVRPDNLIDENELTEYEIYPSPIRSAIFNAGTTSRINVGHFMAELIANDKIWSKWKGKMPVIYNKICASL